MELFVALLVVLTVLTVMGHGIWVLLAAIFRAMLGGSELGHRDIFCPFCNCRTAAARDRCQWCGRTLDDRRGTEMSDLAAFLRQVMRLEKQRLLTVTEADVLRAQAETYRQRLLGQVEEPASASTPSVSPPVSVELPVEPATVEPVEPVAVVEVVEEPREEPPTVEPAEPVELPAPAPVPTPTMVAAPPRPPRKSWLETLAGIMEEREIPWAEPIGLLVGGLLILCSSIALVISLWETLERVPVFKFAVFMGVISMAFGMGLYIYHRWKLESTGRFVLLLATLLVPLGFLAMASLSKEAWTPLILAAEAASLGLSTWLVNMAARVVVPRWGRLEVLAAIGSSAAVLLIARLSGVGLAPLVLTGVGLLPVAVFTTVVGVSLRRAFVTDSDDEDEGDATAFTMARAMSLFTLQGTAAFGTAVALGLLIAKGAQVYGAAMTLDYMGVLFAVLAVPVLAVGLAVIRVAGEEVALGLLRTVGTILAIVGNLGLLVALGMAWPQPAMLLAVGGLGATALVWVALRHSLPIAHAGAMASATVVYLTGFHLLAGHLPLLSVQNVGPEMLRLWTTGQSGVALVGLVVLFGVVAELFARWERREDAGQYAGGSGVLALLSLLVVTGHAMRYSADASLAAVLYAVYGLGALGLNLRYRKAGVTYLGLGLLAAATGWALWWQLIPFGQPWANALLGLATAAVLAGVLFEQYLVHRALPAAEGFRRAFVGPLGDGGLAISVLAGLAMLYGPWSMLPLAVSAFWLAAIWLVVAWTRESTGLVTASQAMLTVATLLATSAWLQRWTWQIDLTSPSVLQTYGLGLAALSLLWIVARIATRPIARTRRLFAPAWPTVDRVVTHGVVAAQLVLAVYHLLPAVGRELAMGTVSQPAAGLEAWLLADLLAVTMLVALWDRWRKAELVSSLLLLGTVPWLVAEPFGAQLAAGSALRWGLAAAFAVGVGLVWQRERLDALARRLHATLDLQGTYAQELASDWITRAVLVTTTALPVLVLTLVAAGIQLSGISLAGPMRASWFFEIGPNVSYLVPLVLVIAGFVGLALRETSAGYAFAAGLVVQMSVVLGYALALTTRGIAIDVAEAVMAVQLATIAAGLWAIVWLVARRWVRVWREESPSGAARFLMKTQLGLGTLGNALLLGPALLEIVFVPWSRPEWSAAVGQVMGWVALASVVAAVVMRQLQLDKRVQPQLAGLTGMTVLALLACSIGAVLFSGDWAYRTLMLGWASYAVFIVLATWWVATLRTLPEAHGPPQALIRATATWVTTAALLAVLLGLKLAVFRSRPEDLLWAAAGIAVASVAGAMMAVWRRQEGWALAAAPGVNLAASLVVWYFHNQLSFESWWTLLLEANVIATASVALLWLAARRRLYALGEMTIRTSPLLALQTGLGGAGCAAMLVPPLGELVWDPRWLPDWAGQLAAPPGWVAVLLAAAAAGWYLRQVSPRDLMHVVAGLGLALGVLASCSTGDDPANTWRALHVLMASWAAVDLVVLGTGYVGRNLRLAGQSDPLDPQSTSQTQAIFPRLHVQGWVTVVGLLAVGLAVLHAVHNPAEPWWPVGTIAAVSVTVGLMAMWVRLPEYVWFSALLVNLAGTVIWWASESQHGPSLVATNALAFALSAGLWSLVGRLHREGLPGWTVAKTRADQSTTSFPPLALGSAMVLAASVVTAFIVWDLAGYVHPAIDWLGWTTLAALGVASLALLWDRTVQYPLGNLYAAGLVGVVMAVEAWAGSPRMLGWLGAVELAGFALLAALVARLLPLGKPVWQTLRIPVDTRDSVIEWFPPVQFVVASAVAGLSAWVAIDPAFGAFGQLAGIKVFGPVIGPVAALCLVVAGVLMADGCSGRWRTVWQQATIGLGVLLMASVGWAWLDPTITAPWLHRSVIAMVAVVAMMLVAGVGLGWLVPAGSNWLKAARDTLPSLAGTAFVLLTAILLQEGLLRAQGQVDFMALPAVAAVAVALVAQVVLAIVFAVVPQWDPLHLSDRGRMAYVYAAEVLVALVGLHLWLTKPHLFQLGMLKHYWMLIVMGVAFGGAVLSELFHRRGFPVLSEPLERTAALLPLAPAIGFWLPIHPSTAAMLAGNSPALWFLAGLFYGFLAISRQSFGYGLLAAVATNLGLSVLWYRLDWALIEHPQIWLIPWGLTILVAEYLNHHRLTSAQSAGLRYLGLLFIYVSSSTEFLRTVGESLWLPMVLIGLSVLGVALGIMLRIRSFLFLGITFLTLVMGTMIWYAAIQQQHMWVFWIFCIGLGMAVLALVAFYEKRRNDVLAAVRQLRQWER